MDDSDSVSLEHRKPQSVPEVVLEAPGFEEGPDPAIVPESMRHAVRLCRVSVSGCCRSNLLPQPHATTCSQCPDGVQRNIVVVEGLCVCLLEVDTIPA